MEKIMFRKLLVILLGLSFLGGFAAAEADGNKGKLVLLVDTHEFADFDAGAPGPGGGFQFYVSGDICKEKTLLGMPTTCTPIGEFHCWGWDIRGTGLAVVSQEYGLDGRGKIQVQGVEDEGPRAVTGGTGEFRNVRGQATKFDFSEFMDTGRFVATFKLVAAGGDDDDDDDD
jgi:hypothetical protein